METPTEKAEAQTTQLIEAYRDEDWQAFDQVITPATRFSDMFVGNDISQAAQATAKVLSHSEVVVRGMTSERDAAGIRVDVRIRTGQAATQGQSPTTAWRFDYSTDDKGVYLDRIEPLSTPFMDAAAVLQYVRRP